MDTASVNPKVRDVDLLLRLTDEQIANSDANYLVGKLTILNTRNVFNNDNY